jgi:8-oxo-dGTP pyrophosphatase MutT (NUDIX family)
LIERLQVVSPEDEPLFGLERDLVVNQGLWRRASGGLIFSDDLKHALCHRRSKSKDERGGVWVATFGGKVLEGESAENAARRELLEEFGVSKSIGELEFFGKFRSVERKQFEYVYWVLISKNSCTLKAQDGEVDQWRWFSVDYLSKVLLSDSRWYIYGYEIDLIRRVTGG